MYSQEFKKYPILNNLYWVFLVGFCFSQRTFFILAANSKNKIENFEIICPPHFQSCVDLIFPATLPNGWGHNVLFAILGLSLFCSAFMFYRGLKKYALLALIPATFLQIFTTFFLTIKTSTPFEYFHTGFLLVLIFFPFKVFFLRVVFVSLYFSSAFVKLDASWIGGDLFNSMINGLPLVPFILTPFLTNIVIIFEGILIFFLFSNSGLRRNTVFYFFVVFHLYSMILVGLRYPIHCLPVLYFLFSPQLHRKIFFPKVKLKHLVFFIYPLFIITMSLLPSLVDPLWKITLVGQRFTLNMFEQNRQCIVNIQTYYKDGTTKTFKENVSKAYDRCNIYSYYFPQKQKCLKNKNIEKSVFNFSASINGGPFLDYVVDKNICELNYNAWSANKWIESPENLRKQINIKKDANTLRWPSMNHYWSRELTSVKKLPRPQYEPQIKPKIVEILRVIYFSLMGICLFISSSLLFRRIYRKEY